MGRILRWGLLQLCQSLVNGLQQSFFQELYSHLDKNSGETFEDMFHVSRQNSK